MIRVVVAVFVLCAFMGAQPAFGQADIDSIVGHEKKPHRDLFMTNKPLPPAEAGRLKDKLHRIRDMILGVPAIQSLRGYDWETSIVVKDPADPSRPVVAKVLYIPFHYFRDPHNGKVASSEEGPPFSIHINDPEAILGQGSYNVDAEARFTAEPRSVGQLGGYPVYAGQFVVMSRQELPLFTPVSQERYLARLIEKSRKDLDKVKATLKGTPDNPAANRQEIESRQAAWKAARAEQEQRWSVMMAKWPDRVAAERAKFDAKEKKGLDEIEELKTSTPSQRYLKPFEERLKALEAELAGLSPEERAATATLPPGTDKTRASGLAAPGSAGGTRIVTINPALFDPKKPRSAIQLIILGTTQYEPKLFDQVQQQLDKTALAGMIE
jgi:hypothetical protein